LLSGPTPPPLNVRLAFENRDGHRFSREFIIDPMQFYGSSWVGGQPLKEAADALKKLQKDVGLALTGFKRLRVETYDVADRDSERAAREERLAALRGHAQDHVGNAESSDQS
jgi:hypothetical protein